MLRLVQSAFFAIYAALAGAASAESLSTADMVALQASMVQFIDDNSTDGLYTSVDLETGEIEQLAPAKSHPTMYAIDDVFVMCTDFRSLDGVKRNVDFYAIRTADGFRVVRFELDNRAPLIALMQAGKVDKIQ